MWNSDYFKAKLFLKRDQATSLRIVLSLWFVFSVYSLCLVRVDMYFSLRCICSTSRDGCKL